MEVVTAVRVHSLDTSGPPFLNSHFSFVGWAFLHNQLTTAPRAMPSLWIVRKTVAQPYCVCCTSICTAFALTCLILGGVAGGVFNVR